MKKITLFMAMVILAGRLATIARQPIQKEEQEMTYGRYMIPGRMVGIHHWRMPMMRIMGVVGLLPGLPEESSLSENQTKLVDLQAD